MIAVGFHLPLALKLESEVSVEKGTPGIRRSVDYVTQRLFLEVQSAETDQTGVRLDRRNARRAIVAGHSVMSITQWTN
jgi:hypothetical protein